MNDNSWNMAEFKDVTPQSSTREHVPIDEPVRLFDSLKCKTKVMPSTYQRPVSNLPSSVHSVCANGESKGAHNDAELPSGNVTSKKKKKRRKKKEEATEAGTALKTNEKMEENVAGTPEQNSIHKPNMMSSNPVTGPSSSRRRKKKTEEVFKARNIAGNRGDDDVDTLVSFVEGIGLKDRQKSGRKPK